MRSALPTRPATRPGQRRVPLAVAVAAATSAALAVAAVLFTDPGAGPADAADLVAKTEALSPEAEAKSFRLPPGFEARLVAAEPDIHKPMNIAFDARGRLWVTSTVEYPWPAKTGAKTRDRLVVLSDFDDSGRARKSVTFADDLNIPIGILPLGDGSRCIVHSIPDVWLLTDTDGDGRADKREVLLSGFGFRDTHGMTNSFTVGFDGWIYACHGFSNQSEIKGRDGSRLSLNSGNTYRFRPDGTRLQQHTWGQVNPFGMCLTADGDLFTADCHSKPITQLVRGGTYSSFGKPHDGLGFAPETCRHSHGSTGIAGVVVYEADALPPEWRGAAFLGNVVTSRINVDKFALAGGTRNAVEQPDFLVSDDPWFRPVSIVLGPDGALYVGDFYNRIIGHYEVPLTHPGRDRERGRIWRIVHRGADGKVPAPPATDFGKLDEPALAGKLADGNLTVRMTAMHVLADRPADKAAAAARAVLGADRPAVQRAHALWVLQRVGALQTAELAAAAADKDGLLRTHAQRILSERTAPLPEAELALVRAGLADADGFVRRAAAEAAGRHPSAGLVPDLIKSRAGAKADDLQARHALRIALRDVFADGAVSTALAKDPPADAAEARAWLESARGVRSESGARLIMAVAGRHATAVGEEDFRTVGRFGTQNERAAATGMLGTVAKADPGAAGKLARGLLKGASERGAGASAEETGAVEQLVGALLSGKDESAIAAGIDLSGSLKLKSAETPVAVIAEDAARPVALRQAAVTAYGQIAGKDGTPKLAALLGDLAQPAGVRQSAAEALGSLDSNRARDALVAALKTLPERLAVPAAAALAGTKPGAEALLAAAEKGQVSARLLQDRGVRTRLNAARPVNFEARIAAATKGLPAEDKRVNDLLAARVKSFAAATPDVARGIKAFEKHCAACHQVAGKGGKVGPQLDGVGLRGPDRLFEDVLDPNRNVDAAFRATLLQLDDDRVVVGLVLREEGAVVVIADQQGKEQSVPKASIARRVVQPLSPMPGNFAEQVPEADLADLVAYLLTHKVAPPKP